jgi:hypothetical protein
MEPGPVGTSPRLTLEKVVKRQAWISHVKDVNKPGTTPHLGQAPSTKDLAYMIVFTDAHGESYHAYYTEAEIEPKAFAHLIPVLLEAERRARLTKKMQQQESQEERDLEDVGWMTLGPPDGNKIARCIRRMQVPKRFIDSKKSYFNAWFIDLTGFTSPKEATVRIETCIAWAQKAERMKKIPRKFGQSGSNLSAFHPRQLSGEITVHGRRAEELPYACETYPLARPRILDTKNADYSPQYAPIGIEPPLPGPCPTLLC